MATLETNRSAGRQNLQAGQIARLMVVDRDGGNPVEVLRTDLLIEAPNWTPDGQWLIVNAGGALYRIAPGGAGGLQRIDTGTVTTCNNDHCLSPDGERIYVSASGHLYVLPVTGGEPRRVSNDHARAKGDDFLYYLHGVSPDESTLAYVSVEPLDGDPRGFRNICLIPTAGGADVRLTSSVHPADGPEWTPDGAWLWFNWEKNAHRPGHAQLFRMRSDGSEVEQMTFDEDVNWFPHVSPDGEQVIFLAYAEGTLSHPADCEVRIRSMPASGGAPRDLVTLFGGQGTLNVNSWAPDNSRFAYVDYPAG